MDCEKCKKNPELVPYIAHESAMARNERTVKRLVIAIATSIVLLFLANAAWLWAWLQYDYESSETVYTQDGEGLNIIGDGNEAEIYGSDSQN